MKKIFFYFFVVVSIQLFSYENSDSCPNCYKNWFKGGALSFSGICLKKGDFKIKNYFIVENVNHFYDDTWLPEKINRRIGFTEVFDLRLGFLPYTDLSVILKEQSQFLNNKSSSRIGDSIVRLGIQLDQPKPLLKTFCYRLTLEQTFPTGHFKNLNPLQRDLEVSGLGYYTTGAIVSAELLSNIQNKLLRTRFNFRYGFSPPSCRLTNYNVYGGGIGTNGRLGSVHDLFALLGLEYTLTQYICLISDFKYVYSSKATFKGEKGLSIFGTPALTEKPVFQSIFMTPGLQINFNYNLGLNLCCWFSAAGKNTPSFQNAVIELVFRN